jgi:hypothetical protein
MLSLAKEKKCGKMVTEWGGTMSESIVELRLVRNLRYKLTYIKIFESYMEPDPGPSVVELLNSLTQAQQSAIAPLSSYLRRQGANIQDTELDEKLLDHAASRDNVRSRLRFIYDGLTRAVSWYKMQLVDRQMTADPELKALLFDLGESDAAQLWRTEATMAMLSISIKAKERDYADQRRIEPDRLDGWRPSLVEDVERTTWESPREPRWPPSRGQDRRDL